MNIIDVYEHIVVTFATYFGFMEPLFADPHKLVSELLVRADMTDVARIADRLISDSEGIA